MTVQIRHFSSGEAHGVCHRRLRTYLVATARGHIFNDANKRTVLNSVLLFLRRNGVQVYDSPMLVDFTVGAATGKIHVSSVAETLRELYGT
ncbi:type II toxin-antitoxin system death-on-curing family toxin [Escherichia coli]|nr:type II toxin-antitoxin system death-on-curing family toxin [Escherichia coli]